MTAVPTRHHDTGWIRWLLNGPHPSRVMWRLRLGLIAAMHVTAVYILASVEYGTFANVVALLTWLLLNFTLLIVLRRPGASAAIALVFVALLIAVSQFKFGIMQLTLTFLDFLIIDRDTFAFLHSVFPQLRTQSIVLTAIAVPVLWLIWRADPFRVRRAPSLIGALVCGALITGLSTAWPEQPWEPFQGVNHISNLARSGVVSVSHLTSIGWIEAEPRSAGAGTFGAATPCATNASRPNIVMVLDESSFDLAAAPGIKLPPGYQDYFKSADGKQRRLVTESSGGPTWYTEFNVLTGLSADSFGKLKFYVTRIAAGKITRGLPAALATCGDRTVSLYPTYGDFLRARTFQAAAGVDRFVDMAAMGVSEDMQPDRFYFDQAVQAIARERQASNAPVFVLVYLTANHFPWTSEYRPDLTPPSWIPPGNSAEVDEYLRRQAMTAADYARFLAQLKQDYPADPFLIVRFGDHQPAISQKLLEPGLPPAKLANRIMTRDRRYYETYYAIDAFNYKPDMSSAMDPLDAAYLPLAVLGAAGVPLEPSFAEQRAIMRRCNGVFYACNGGTEARRFNRMLINAGMIRGL